MNHERPKPANFDEAVIDAQLAARRGQYHGCFAPQYGRGPVPPIDEERDDEQEQRA